MSLGAAQQNNSVQVDNLEKQYFPYETWFLM